MDRREMPSLPAKASQKRLGVFPLGSARSRAAARALLAARKEAELPGIVFVARSILDGSELDRGEPPDRATESNGVLRRIIVDL